MSLLLATMTAIKSAKNSEQGQAFLKKQINKAEEPKKAEEPIVKGQELKGVTVKAKRTPPKEQQPKDKGNSIIFIVLGFAVLYFATRK